MLSAFEAWEINNTGLEEVLAQAQAGKTVCFTLIAKDGEPRKLYEACCVYYGNSSDLETDKFLKVNCKKATNAQESPGDSPLLTVGVHTSTLIEKTPYSTALATDPDVAAKFMPAKVSFLPVATFTKLDRCYLRKLDPPPAAWTAYAGEITSRTLVSMPAVAAIKPAKVSKKDQKKRRRDSSTSSETPESEVSSEEVRRREPSKQANKQARQYKVRKLARRTIDDNCLVKSCRGRCPCSMAGLKEVRRKRGHRTRNTIGADR